jgi:hypothetical protein
MVQMPIITNSESLISVQAFTGLDNQTVSSLLDESTSWDSDTNYQMLPM